MERAELTPLYDPARGPMRTAIFMSGSGTNAERIIKHYAVWRENAGFEPVLLFTDNLDSRAMEIARAFRKSDGIELALFEHSLRPFYEKRGAPLKDMDVRREYDAHQARLLRDFGIDAVALAGYDWTVTEPILDHLTINVHPGDLRVHGPDARRRYVGLAWTPSAKTILDIVRGEREEQSVNGVVHLVTKELDEGPLLALSEPVPVPREAVRMTPGELLEGKASFKEFYAWFKTQAEVYRDEQLRERVPLYRFAKQCQDQLKERSDWVIFPRTLERIANGEYARDATGAIYHNGTPVPDGVAFGPAG